MSARDRMPPEGAEPARRLSVWDLDGTILDGDTHAFVHGRVMCPAGVSVPMVVGQIAHFPSDICAVCPQRPRCTTAAGGRSLSIHPAEPFLVELRARQRTPQGRAVLRRRVVVEHRHADLQRRQGPKARYRGVRKNLLDVRRHAAVHNLFAAAVAA